MLLMWHSHVSNWQWKKGRCAIRSEIHHSVFPIDVFMLVFVLVILLLILVLFMFGVIGSSF